MRSTIAFMAFAFTLVGCGANVAPVSGRVTLDNKPLVNAMIIFQPDSGQKNPGPGSQAKTNANGEYTLQLMTGETKGAILGKHVVSITAYEGDDADIPSSGSDNKVFRKRIVPEKYSSDSILTFEVPAGGSTTANFDLTSGK